MYRNSYAGLLEPWKLKLLSDRARRFGVRGHDLDDIQQEIVLELLAFQFDPTRAHGATESTVVVAVIDRRLAMFCRREQRYRQRTQRLVQTIEQASGDGCCLATLPQHDSLAMDVRDAIERLPAAVREVCVALSDGWSISEIARRLGMSWRAVRRHMQHALRHFRELGLGDDAWGAAEVAR